MRRKKDMQKMSIVGLIAIVAMILAILVTTPTRMLLANDDKSIFVANGTVTAGNTFYEVHVEDISGFGVGLYTATTGPTHPAGSGLNVLYGDGSPGTTFNTIRSYTSGTDYVQSSGKTSANAVVFLDPFGMVTPIGTTGFRTTYILPGSLTTPDALTIVSDVNVNGTTFANSSIEVTTTVTNDGPAPVDIGVRYHWDFQIDADDGPTFQELNPDGPVRVTEAEFVVPGFESYQIEDNDLNPSPPTLNILGTATGPATVVPTPTVPDLLQHVCWSDAFGTAFEYTVDPTRDIATTASDCRGFAGGDTAAHYVFGPDALSALTIPPGGTVTVSASLFLTSPEVEGPPVSPTCSDGIDNDLDGLVDNDDPDCQACGDGDLDPGEECDDGNTEDGDGCSSICQLENQPPDCGMAAPSISELWPPNHKPVPVTIVDVVDPDEDLVSTTIDSIFQDEAVDAAGSGNTCPDAAGVGTDAALVLAERVGTKKAPGDGRVYHIGFTADDGMGGTCTGEVTVCVPHDRGQGLDCVDQGPLFDATVCP